MGARPAPKFARKPRRGRPCSARNSERLLLRTSGRPWATPSRPTKETSCSRPPGQVADSLWRQGLWHRLVVTLGVAGFLFLWANHHKLRNTSARIPRGGETIAESYFKLIPESGQRRKPLTAHLVKSEKGGGTRSPYLGQIHDGDPWANLVARLPVRTTEDQPIPGSDASNLWPSRAPRQKEADFGVTSSPGGMPHVDATANKCAPVEPRHIWAPTQSGSTKPPTLQHDEAFYSSFRCGGGSGSSTLTAWRRVPAVISRRSLGAMWSMWRPTRIAVHDSTCILRNCAAHLRSGLR